MQSSQPTAISQIVKWLRSVLVKFVDFFGSKRNLNHFMLQVGEMLRLTRFECWHFSMDGIKVTEIKWMFKNHSGQVSNANHHAQITETATVVLSWLIQMVVVPLIKLTYYITESSHCKNRVFFYRHDVWNNMCRNYTDKL